MNRDRGVIYALVEEFNTHLYPRAVALEKRLASGRRLSLEEIDYLAEVTARIAEIRPLVDRHPEYADLAAGVMQLYAAIARHARANELDPNCTQDH